MKKNTIIMLLLSVASLSAQDSLRDSWNALKSAFTKTSTPAIPPAKLRELESTYLQAQLKEQSKDYSEAAAFYQKVVDSPYRYPVLQNGAKKRLDEMRKKKLI